MENVIEGNSGCYNLPIYFTYPNLNETTLFHHYCSIMQAACDIAFQYAHTRETFGQKIGTYQVRNHHQRNRIKLKYDQVLAKIIRI